MKRIFYIVSALFMLALASCDNTKNIQGQWSIQNAGIEVLGATVTNSSMVMTFSQDGKVAISAEVALSQPATGLPDSIAAEVSLNAIATIDGTWEYLRGENDEVNLYFNDDSFSLNVDPTVVTLLPYDDVATLNAVQDAMGASYTDILTTDMRSFFNRFHRLEDIKVIKGTTSIMEFEVDMPSGEDITYVLKRI